MAVSTIRGLAGYPGAPGVINALTGGEYVHGVQLQGAVWTDVAVAINALSALGILPVASLTALRSVNKLLFTQALVAGAYTARDGGGGRYHYVSSDTTTGALFTASISGTTMTVSAVTNGTLAIGQTISGLAVGLNLYISALGTGTGGTGTYTLSYSNTIGSRVMTSDNGGTIIVAFDGGRWYWNPSGGPVTCATFGVIPDGTSQFAWALQAALTWVGNTGGGLLLAPDNANLCLLERSVTIPASTRLKGNKWMNTFRAVNTATGIGSAMFIMGGNFSGLDGIGIDGNLTNNTAQGFGGVGVFTSYAFVTVRNCYIHDTIYNAINYVPATGQCFDATVEDNYIGNCGWEGIALRSCAIFACLNNVVVSSGSNGIVTGYSGTLPSTGNLNTSSDGLIEGNYINRATAPTHTLSSFAQNGFLIAIGAGDSTITINENECWDNRTAANDGIGLGQDGVNINTDIIISNNKVHYAGLFGIDATSNNIVTGNYVRFSAQCGIKLGTDAGGNLVNCVVEQNIVDSCNFAGTGSTEGIWVDATLTVPVPTAIYENIKINDNIVIEFGTGHTVYGLNIGFRNNLTYVNCEFKNNDFSGVPGVNGNAFHVSGPGSNYVGWSYKGNRHPLGMPAIAGATALVMGLDNMTMTNGSATNVTNFLGGFDGQEIMMQLGNANTTYVPGSGILTPGTVNFPATANSLYKFVRYSGFWYLNKFFAP